MALKKSTNKKTLFYEDLNSDDGNYDTLKKLIATIDLINDNYHSYLLENKTQINFSISVLPHCCGISEFGDISVNTKSDIQMLTKFLDEIVNSVKGHTFIINTNGIDDSARYEKALANCKNWTLVKTFKNANSGNTIKMWISTNK